MPEVVCKDCIAEGVTRYRPPAVIDRRGTLAPGKRCTTHHRARRNAVRSNAHGRRIEKEFGITAEQYWALYAAQGGRCYICRVASGKRKKLAVDHDHETGLVRGLLCGPDNVMIGRLRMLGLVNALNYLNNPPAFAVIGHVVVPSMQIGAVDAAEDAVFENGSTGTFDSE